MSVSLDTNHGPVSGGRIASLLALSHTPVEHRLYEVMLAEAVKAERRAGSFSIQRLMRLTGLNSTSTVRRGRAGLVEKLSIERLDRAAEETTRDASLYLVFTPEEIFKRRRAASLMPYPAEFSPTVGSALERVVERYDLSRREAQVALCCAEGLTNAEIGERLFICKQTVKFHLRNIFQKFGVKRRTELISRLFRQGDTG